MFLIPFSLGPQPGDFFVRFPFFFNGQPWAGLNEGPEVSCGLSLRNAGEMGYDPARENPNRDRLFGSLGLSGSSVAARRQTHSKDVLVVESIADLRSSLPEGDGLAAIDSSVVLSVTVADCLPVYLADTRSGAFSLVHSGWKGTGIVRNALSLMKDRWGTEPGFVSAVLGPCIRGCCYQVDEQRAQAFDAEFGAVSLGRSLGPALRRAGSRAFIDLQAANAALLEESGVKNIAVCRDCTFTDERLGSFRREGADRFTRMVALLGRLP